MSVEDRRPRVLLIAESANPEWSSVPLEGWSHSRALAEVADVHLVTQVRNRRAILAAGLSEGTDFTAIDSEATERFSHRLASMVRGGRGKGWTTVTALSSLVYPFFEHLVWKQFGGRIAAKEFDVVHRLIPLSPTAQSPMARRCRRVGVPFVLGPLNGGLPWPKEYRDVQFKEREWLSILRSAYKLLPYHGSTRRDAAAIIIGSVSTWGQMSAKYHHKCIYIPENAIDPGRFPPPGPREASSLIRLAFIGRLVPYKGAHLAIEAAAPFLRSGAMSLDIVGDGPQRGELEQLVEREGLVGRVVFHGQVMQKQVAQLIEKTDIFIFPSIREFGGAVVLEGMAMGAVPMIVNYGGPAELATEETGFLVELGNSSRIVDRLREMLGLVVEQPSILDAKREAGMARARGLFTWRAKAEQVREVYRWVLGLRSDKPTFSMPLR